MQLGRFGTRAINKELTAPEEGFSTIGVLEALLRLGMIRPWAPEASAVLIKAPKLCGSSIPSHKMTKGCSPLFFAKSNISDTWAYLIGLVIATTP